MQTYGQTTTGAQTLKFDIPGKYFVLLATTLGVNIRFYKLGKKLDLGDISNLMAGVEATLGQPDDSEPAFTRVEIDTLGADTIQFGIGNGQVRYNRSQGNVAITSGTINNVQAISQVNKVIAPDAKIWTQSYKSLVGMGANIADPIFLAAANVNGAEIIKADLYCITGGGLQGLIAKNGTPANLSDGTLLVAGYPVAGAHPKIDTPLYVPPGLGLYYLCATAEGTVNRSLLWRFL